MASSTETVNLPFNVQCGLAKWQAKPHKSLSILVAGKTGTGKSTLTNAILGYKVEDVRAAHEGNSIKSPGTTLLKQHREYKEGVKIAVWDSLGLQDGTQHQDEHVHQMKKQCSGVDLVMYCINMSEDRFVRGDQNPDIVTIKKLTAAFGEEFWQKAIIVLTFANLVEMALNVKKLKVDQKATEFSTKLQDLEKQIKETLIDDVHIPQGIVNEIIVVPAGHTESSPHLLGQEYWLSNLWFHCLYTISSPEAQCALLQMNMTRFTSEQDVKQEEFESNEAELQPIVFAENILKSILPGNTFDAVFKGATFGASIGKQIGGQKGQFIGAAAGGALVLFAAYSGEIGKQVKKLI